MCYVCVCVFIVGDGQKQTTVIIQYEGRCRVSFNLIGQTCGFYFIRAEEDSWISVFNLWNALRGVRSSAFLIQLIRFDSSRRTGGICYEWHTARKCPGVKAHVDSGLAQIELCESPRPRHSQLHEPSHQICKITMHNVT